MTFLTSLFSLLFITGGVHLPNGSLLVWIGVAMLIDFITGVAKAKTQGKARTSSGFRQTIIKTLEYLGTIAVSIIISNTASGDDSIPVVMKFFDKGLYLFILYIEITSILENLYAIDSTSSFSNFLIHPALKALTFGLKNNPVTKIAAQLEQAQPPTTVATLQPPTTVANEV